MDARTIVGKNIARLRAAKGLSQNELADRITKLQMSQSYVSKLERGTKNVSIMTLAVIAEALEVTLVDLVSYNPNEMSS